MQTFTIVEHFNKEEDPDCDGDFEDLEILDENGVCVRSYGDYYHDKGSDKACGFIDGVRFATGEEIKVEYKNVADREW